MSTLLDDKTMQLIYSSSNTLHVKSWFNKTACGKDCWDHYKWQFGGLTNLRWVAKLAQSTKPTNFCKRCARIYKDVNVDG